MKADQESTPPRNGFRTSPRKRPPKDPTSREKFSTHCFAEHKKQMVDFLTSATCVSFETMQMVEAMKA